MSDFTLSATSISAFLACPMKWRLHYIEKLRPRETPEALRQGTLWHSLMELGANEGFEAAIQYLEERYAQRPDLEVEKETLAALYAGHTWWHMHDVMETLETEHPFDIDTVVGKIDGIIKYNGRRMLLEFKTTSQQIDGEADYWDKLNIDKQVSMYLWAARQLKLNVSAVLYDVTRKPTIKPKYLSAKDTQILLDSSEYCKKEFDVHLDMEYDAVIVNGYQLEQKELKGGQRSVKESPEMFGARLLMDIYTRPEHYYQRREVVRLDHELDQFGEDLTDIRMLMEYVRDAGLEIRNEQSCITPYRCQYTNHCWRGDDSGLVQLTTKETDA